MFDALSTRIATRIVAGLDLAVEFATLGEYRLAPSEDPEPPVAAAPRPVLAAGGPEPVRAVAPRAAGLPVPATAAASPTLPGPGIPPVFAREAGDCAPRRVRGAARLRATPRARSRAGAVPTGEQLCLWS